MKTSDSALMGLVGDLTLEERAELYESDNRPLIKKMLARMRARRIRNTFIVPLEDEKVAEALKSCLPSWRSLATSLGYAGPVTWQVRKGFTLKGHAPKVGPCYKNWEYLKDWKLKNDETIVDSTAFWVPRLVEGSRSKSVDEQMTLFSQVRERHRLPKGHLTSFGSAALLSGLIMAHFKRAGERVPLQSLWARTDTFRGRGLRLCLGVFGTAGLGCDDWDWDVERYDDLGAFPLGVEVLGL